MQQRLIAVLALCTLALTVTVEPDIGQQPSDNRVTIELYYESLCPFCHKFMTEQLQLVLALPGIWDIADFKLYPYGNAETRKRGKNYDFMCQHGPAECQGNIIDTCALNMFSQQQVSIPFALCMMASTQSWNEKGARCAQQTGADWNRIKSCTNSFYGRQWQFQNGLKTDYVKVDHVPYVLVDGAFDRQSEQYVLTNLLATICKMYSGPIQKDYCAQYTN